MAEQMDLLGSKPSQPRIKAFDLETLHFAEEVGRWDHISKMGLACGVTYDSVDQAYRVFFEKDATALVEDLRRADLVVGFNHVRFDYEVLSAYTSFNLRSLPSLDMLVEVKRALGHRLKLNSLVKATLGDEKTADGLQSLRWVKEGRLDLVSEYCKKDVEVTWRLFDYGVKNGEIKYEKYGSLVPIPVDWRMESICQRSQGTQ